MESDRRLEDRDVLQEAIQINISRLCVKHFLLREREHGLDVVWLPCGHYTTGELPWKAIDAWKIATFFRKQFKAADERR